MFAPAQYLLSRVQSRLGELQIVGETGNENLSVKRGLTLSLRYLEARGQGGAAKMKARLGSLAALLQRLGTLDASRASGASELQQKIMAVLADPAQNLETLELAIDGFLTDIEQLLSAERLGQLPPEVVQAMVDWEAQDLQLQVDSPAPENAAENDSPWQPVRRQSLQDYLRDRFNEADLEVTAFQPLAGGFGKETVLFSVRGRQFNGDFVIRRDRPIDLIGNDCHLVSTEFPLLRAVHAHGIPTANALWLQRSSEFLPGADFIVMERVNGVTGGSVFGTGQSLDPAIADLLGEIVARIHKLPPLTELGMLTESITPQHWNMPLRDCMRDYLTRFFTLYRETAHFPSLAIAAQFNWLLHNIPQPEGSPCLVHGDIGLHNMLLEDGRINALFDWEFAHVGDPAEDLAYIKSTMGKSLDWKRFMASYVSHGGRDVSVGRLRFYQVWGLLRNAAGGSMIFGTFAHGVLTDPTTMLVLYEYGIQYIRAAQALIDSDIGTGDQ